MVPRLSTISVKCRPLTSRCTIRPVTASIDPNQQRYCSRQRYCWSMNSITVGWSPRCGRFQPLLARRKEQFFRGFRHISARQMARNRQPVDNSDPCATNSDTSRSYDQVAIANRRLNRVKVWACERRQRSVAMPPRIVLIACLSPKSRIKDSTRPACSGRSCKLEATGAEQNGLNALGPPAGRTDLPGDVNEACSTSCPSCTAELLSVHSG